MIRVPVARVIASKPAAGALTSQNQGIVGVVAQGIPATAFESSTSAVPITANRLKLLAAVAGTIVAVAIGWLSFLHFAKPEPARISLAVLPFQGPMAGTE
jgi:hypothetical protein